MAFIRIASSWSPVLLITKADRVGVDAWSTWSGSWWAMFSAELYVHVSRDDETVQWYHGSGGGEG